MGRKLLATFKTEIDNIHSEELKLITKEIISERGDWLYEKPTSSSGKYHPNFANGKAGLIKHTKAVCILTGTLLEGCPQYDNTSWDIVYIAAILHDLAKYTDENAKHTDFEHPVKMAEIIREKIPENEKFADELERIAKIVETHMGQFNKRDNIILPVPNTIQQLIVHFADMIASRKFLNIPFDEQNNISY